MQVPHNPTLPPLKYLQTPTSNTVTIQANRMTIRNATPSDFHEMAQVAAAAFMDEELFGELMHPHRHSYPSDFVAFFERLIWGRYWDWNCRYLVSIDSKSQRMLGIAMWERQGAPVLGKWDPRELRE